MVYYNESITFFTLTVLAFRFTKNISDFVEFRNNNGSSDLLLKKFEQDFGKFSKNVITSDDSGGYDASSEILPSHPAAKTQQP